MHPLDGPRLKIRCAERELDSLRVFFDRLRDEAQYKIVPAEYNGKTGKQTYRVLVNAVPAPDVGVIIGEIAHNLRSALDGLVYRLAERNPALKGKAPTGTQFPIFLKGRPPRCRRKRCKAGGGHFHCRGRTMIRLIKPEHKAVLEGLQPYKRGRGGRGNPLWLLSEMNNADKHRLLQVVAGGVGGFIWDASTGEDIPELSRLGYRGARVRDERFYVLEDGAIVFEMPAHMNVNPKIIPTIRFWEGCAELKRLQVVPTLSAIADHVSDIFESFRPEFE